MSRSVEIPYSPRKLQLDYHDNRTRFSVIVCHRRFGKTVMLVNDAIRSALLCKLERPRVAYIAPTYAQSKKIAWDYFKHFAAPIPDVKFNESELRVDFPNGGRIQLLGQDNPDSLRGSYFDAVYCDEFQMWSPRVFPEIIRPALADRKGTATFSGTPAGTENPLHDAWTQAQLDAWYCRMHKASETGYVDAEELESSKRTMSDEQYAQEFECSWEASIIGSIYGHSITKATEDGRVTRVPIEPTVPVDVSFDLGMSDATSLFFIQKVGLEVRIVDYYEASGEALNHYVNIINDWCKNNGVTFGTAILPHDARARELGTGKSRLEVLQSMRLNCMVAPNIGVMDGVEAVRQMLKTCWIDNSRDGSQFALKCLMNYRREYNDKRRVFYDRPLHDWSSHCADALRMYAVAQDRVSQSDWSEIEYNSYGVI